MDGLRSVCPTKKELYYSGFILVLRSASAKAYKSNRKLLQNRNIIFNDTYIIKVGTLSQKHNNSMAYISIHNLLFNGIHIHNLLLAVEYYNMNIQAASIAYSAYQSGLACRSSGFDSLRWHKICHCGWNVGFKGAHSTS
uniref:Uncharacterized protein n=1 Tax=Cacopsylla melanoneura TaxID=428564 RepID=A0A8D8R420_9HEMI